MTQNTPRIDLAAAEWAVRLNGRELTGLEQAELDQWLEADIRHRGALLRANATWLDLDRLSALAGPVSPGPHRDEPADLKSGPVGSASAPPFLPSGLGDGKDVLLAVDRPLVRGRRRFLASGIAAMLCAAAGSWWIGRQERTYVSKLGQVRRVDLSDGSRMVLNTASQATVHFDEAHREIELTAGEGLFQVAKDPARPFVVRAGFVSVRAVGTVFAVRAAGPSVDVTVTEGVVELVDNGTPAGVVIRRIAANERATVRETSHVQVQTMPHAEAERRLAWRDGMVDFAGEPLSAAVSEVNRHNRRQIVVDDATLASRPVVGMFRATDPDNFASTVATALGVQTVNQGDAIHLRPRSTP